MQAWSPRLEQWRTQVLEPLGRGLPVHDDAFDAVYPLQVQKASAVHWTPVHVAQAAAPLLAPRAGTRVLDVGSGAGKMCLIGATMTGAVFVGVEQRPSLVQLSRDLAGRCGVDNAQFIQGNAVDLDWSGFDAVYLYNPFIENILAVEDQIDPSMCRRAELVREYVDATATKLAQARVGMRVVTYHGFGGVLPVTFHLRQRVDVGTASPLELWEQQAGPRQPFTDADDQQPSAVLERAFFDGP